MAVQQWLGESFVEFLSAAMKLGEAVKNFEFGRFQCTLRELGIGDDEIVDLWNAIDMKGRFEDGDTQISSRCGILLATRIFPRNFLLYRFVSLKYPAVVSSVRVETIPHEASVLEGRWEYAGAGKKNILKLQCPCAPKRKKSTGALRRNRRFSRSDAW